MARVTADQVKEIITTSIADAVILSNFIDTATLLVDEYLLDAELSASMLTKIELYLAAHLVALTDERGGLVRSGTGDAAETYSDVFKAGLNSTRYGQMALALDVSGTLRAATSTEQRAEFRIV